MERLGLALSGGGSRAAGFHRGTLQGLKEVGLLDQIDVVSSVSGGSIFAAAWLAARWKGDDVATFLRNIGQELAQGFIRRSLTPKLLKLTLPYYTRANLLADTFDRTLMHGMRLGDLPEKPLLCINTSVMNTGQVGKFSRDGFSSSGLTAPGKTQGQSNSPIPLTEFAVALAATASAAFPIGLPPVYLRRGEHVPAGWGGPDLAHHATIALTDGGVLENLGVQTLLKSRRYGAWDIVISDAGQKEEPWNPRGFTRYLRGALMGALGLATMERIAGLMNAKENRHMRSSAFGEIERTWLIDALREDSPKPGIAEFLSSNPVRPRRRILFVQLNQTLAKLLAAIPRWRLREVAARAARSLPAPLPPIRETLEALGITLKPTLDIHAAMGGDSRIAELNEVPTQFTALSKSNIDALHEHARWQVHAMRALYWD